MIVLGLFAAAALAAAICDVCERGLNGMPSLLRMIYCGFGGGVVPTGLLLSTSRLMNLEFMP